MNLEKLISDFLETGGKIKKCRTATAKGSKVLKMVKRPKYSNYQVNTSSAKGFTQFSYGMTGKYGQGGYNSKYIMG